MSEQNKIEPHQPVVNVIADLLSKSFEAAVSWTLEQAPSERTVAAETIAPPERTDPPEAGAEGLRWFRQSFSGMAGLEIQVAIPADAAFLEDQDALPTVFAKLAEGLTTSLGVDIAPLKLTEEEPPADPLLSFFRVGGSSGFQYAVTESTLELVGTRLSVRLKAAAPPGAKALDALMDVDLPVSISFGTVEIPLGDVLKLSTGSIVEFHHPLNSPVNVIVNNRIVARGDVVDVDGHYGVRVSEIVSSGTFV